MNEAPQVIPEILDQHVEEAAMLWVIRDNAVHQPHYDLEDLTELDERLEAHIDGLRISGEAAWERALEELVWAEAGEIFTAAVLALESGEAERIGQVIQAVADNPDLQRALLSALGWIPYKRISPTLEKLSGSPEQHLLSISAYAVHRVDPGQSLASAVKEKNAPLHYRALRAAGELGRKDLLLLLLEHIQADDDKTRFWAAWSAVFLGDKSAAPNVLKTFISPDAPFHERALQIWLRIIDTKTAGDWLNSLPQSLDWQRIHIIGCGISGDPAHVPWLIEQMELPVLSRIAGEAFCFISGLDLDDAELETQRPEDFQSGPTEDPEDEDTALDPDDNLPWPDATGIRAWWKDNGNQFKPGVRYLAGRVITEEHCQMMLRHGLQRQRQAAALELALMRENAMLFETRAPGLRQMRQLAVSCIGGD